jgi:hypothetical protein
METEELVRLLGPVRLPIEFARFGISDALAAFALGLLMGLLLDRLLQLVTVRSRSPGETACSEIARLARLTPEHRLVGLARLLDRFDPQHSVARPADLPHALYSREGALDLDPLERAVLEAARRRRS